MAKRTTVPPLRTAFALLLCAAIASPASAEENYIESSAGAGAIALGMLDISQEGRGTLSEDLNSVLVHDLEWPGRFRVLRSARVEKSRWTAENVFSFVHGSYSVSGDSLLLELELSDLVSMRTVPGMKRVWKSHRKQARRAVHEFADMLAKQFYGEEGAATTKVLFVRRGGGKREIWMMDYDGANARQITKDGNVAMLPAWSADGKTVHYSSFLDGHAALRTIGQGRSASAPLTPKGVHAYGGRESPDGTKTVYVRETGSSTDLWLMDMKTGKSERLTFHSATETSPDWSPNGESLVFTSDRGGRPQLYTIGADGSGEERLTFTGTYVESGVWSPAGDKVAYCAMTEGQFSLFVLDLATGETAQITSGRGNDESPSWSPDGRMIIFASDRTGVSQLYLIRPDGTGLVQLTREGNNAAPRWSPGTQKKE